MFRVQTFSTCGSDFETLNIELRTFVVANHVRKIQVLAKTAWSCPRQPMLATWAARRFFRKHDEIKYGLVSSDSHGQLGKDAYTSRMSKTKWGDSDSSRDSRCVMISFDFRSIAGW